MASATDLFSNATLIIYAFLLLMWLFLHNPIMAAIIGIAIDVLVVFEAIIVLRIIFLLFIKFFSRPRR